MKAAPKNAIVPGGGISNWSRNRNTGGFNSGAATGPSSNTQDKIEKSEVNSMISGTLNG
jgi:hypothetical protein